MTIANILILVLISLNVFLTTWLWAAFTQRDKAIVELELYKRTNFIVHNNGDVVTYVRIQPQPTHDHIATDFDKCCEYDYGDDFHPV
jgi:hypothetical protein